MAFVGFCFYLNMSMNIKVSVKVGLKYSNVRHEATQSHERW